MDHILPSDNPPLDIADMGVELYSYARELYHRGHWQDYRDVVRSLTRDLWRCRGFLN